MKVIVIGGSTSGLFAAYLLAKGGVEVEVYERMNALGSPSRTLIVTGKMNEILGFVPEEAITNQVGYLELFSKARSARVALGCPDLVIERGKLIGLLARMAVASGAKIVLQHQFQAYAQSGKKVLVRFQDLGSSKEKQVSADILVGADGTTSDVSLAASRNGHRRTALLQARVRMPDVLREDTCKVWFVADQTKYFYWLIPESKQVAAVGLIAEEADEAKASLTAFLQAHRLEPLEFQSASVPLYRFEYSGNDRGLHRNVFLVGDAAAQVKTTTVGGLVTGLHGAKGLAQVILNGKNYRKELSKLKLELNLHLLVRHILNRFNNDHYDELIEMLKGGLKEVIEEWTRDDLSRSFLRLIRKEPRLITLGTKAILRSLFQ
jgi:flavin-dependent dehydrogenase